MDLSSHKSKLKLLLFITAIVIAIVTLLFTNNIANTIAREEEQKVKIWAEAIKRKADLVRFTQELFDKLSKDERKKVEIYSKAQSLIISVNDDNTITYLSEIIQSNNSIPVILTDEHFNIKDFKNCETFSLRRGDTLCGDALSNFSLFPPIRVDYGSSQDLIHYRNSKIFTDLEKYLNSILSNYLNEIVSNSSSLPVLLVDSNLSIIAFGNIPQKDIKDKESIKALVAKMASIRNPIKIDLGDNKAKYIYYQNSPLINQLKYYPLILLAIIGAFLIIAYFAFSTTRKAEQNLVWVGMAKETAHQLGTPISSLSAWVEYMKERESNDAMEKKLIAEVEKDVNRLTLISDRFSKIGAAPKLELHNVEDVLSNSVSYIKSRISKKVKVTLVVKDGADTSFQINTALFDWVIENLLKNAVDAIGGEGEVDIVAFQELDDIIIEISDSGKGIPSNKLQSVFNPGYSTKNRGWGLGLTLCKRIIENYFYGKIFVKKSEIDIGTTFRIEIPV